MRSSLSVLGDVAVKALPALIVSALFAASGCKSDQQTAGQTSSPAIQTSGTTHVQQQDQQNQFAMAFPTGDRNTSTLLIEETAPKQVRVEHDATAQVRVTNLTNAPVRDITLWNKQNDAFRVTSVSNATTRPSQQGQIAYNIGNLGPKESKTFQIGGIAERVGTVENCFAVTYQPPMLCTTMEVVKPALQVVAEGRSEIDICDPIDYRYTVTNTGSGLARNVVLREQLPDGLTTADGQRLVSADLGDIPQGQSRSVTAHLKAARTGRFTTRAVAQSRDDTAHSPELATVVHAPALAMAIKGPEQEYVGKQVNYQIVVTNKGDAPARDATLKLRASDTGRVVAWNMGGNGEAQLAANRQAPRASESLGTINPGESRTITVTAMSNQGGMFTLDADAAARCAPAVTQQTQTRFATIPALLLETVDESDPVRVGEQVIYDVKVTNQGSGPDTNVKVTATLPDGVEFVGAKGATEGTVEGNTITFAAIPTLAPKQSATWKITVKALRPGDVQFKTTASSNEVKAPAEKVEPTKLY